jgi:hypothetical protein
MKAMKTVQEVMMTSCKANKTPIWCLIMHNREKELVGYYCKGIGNDLHKNFAITWLGSLSSHLRYFLLRCMMDSNGMTALIKQSFDYHAIVDASNRVLNDKGKVVSKAQATAEQKLAEFDQRHAWIDGSLGRTSGQQMAYEQALAVRAAGKGQYNLNNE